MNGNTMPELIASKYIAKDELGQKVLNGTATREEMKQAATEANQSLELPVEVTLTTAAKTDEGVVEISVSLPRGIIPTSEQLKLAYDNAMKDGDLPPDARPITKVEWLNHLARKDFGVTFNPFPDDIKLPGGNDWKV